MLGKRRGGVKASTRVHALVMTYEVAKNREGCGQMDEFELNLAFLVDHQDLCRYFGT